jgi:hypothetical protein
MVANGHSRRGRSTRKRRIPPGVLESQLKREDAIAVFGAANVAQHKRKLKRDKRNLQRMVPSQPWFDAAWYGEWTLVAPDVSDVVPAPFPPGGDLTGMQTCKGCGHMTPAIYLTTSGHCQDCKYGGMSPFQLHLLAQTLRGELLG